MTIISTSSVWNFDSSAFDGLRFEVPLSTAPLPQEATFSDGPARTVTLSGDFSMVDGKAEGRIDALSAQIGGQAPLLPSGLLRLSGRL